MNQTLLSLLKNKKTGVLTTTDQTTCSYDGASFNKDIDKPKDINIDQKEATGLQNESSSHVPEDIICHNVSNNDDGASAEQCTFDINVLKSEIQKQLINEKKTFQSGDRRACGCYSF